MIRLEWSSRFEKVLQKWIAMHPESREVIKQKLQLFSVDPYAPELKNHKLSGRLKDLRAISVAYSQSAIFVRHRQYLETGVVDILCQCLLFAAIFN